MKLFVGNLPYSATEADITDFFTQAGVSVDSVNVMRDRFTGEARGFGFVEINDDTAANHAIEACNGRDLMGRAMVVNEARPMVPREVEVAAVGARVAGGVKAAGTVEAASLTVTAGSSFQNFRNRVRIVRHHNRLISETGLNQFAFGIFQLAGVVLINIIRVF
jgi:RNA recognition motif-containing protein